MTTSDSALLTLWHDKRDADAFTELMTRYSGVVYATCRRVMGNAAEAEDVAQECFLTLMEKRVEVRSSLGAWLHTVALRRSLDRLKSEKRRKAREERYVAQWSELSTEEVDDLLWRLDEAIEDLPDSLKGAIIGRFLEGQTHAAIGEKLGIAEATVRHRVKQGVERIGQFMKHRGITMGAGVLAGVLGAEMSEAAPVTLAQGVAKRALVSAARAQTAASAGLLGTKTVLAVLALTSVALIALWGGNRLLGHAPGKSSAESSQGTAEADAPNQEAATRAMGPSTTQEEAAGSAAQPPRGEDTQALAPDGTETDAATENEGVITGRIFEKKTGKPIEGVTIYASRDAPGQNSARLATSDAAGHFTLVDLPTDKIRIHTSHIKGYATEWNTQRQKVILTAQEATAEIEFPVEKWIHISGMIVSNEGKPVAGARIGFHGAQEPLSERHYSNHSASDGLFELFIEAPAEAFQIQAVTYNKFEDTPEKAKRPDFCSPVTGPFKVGVDGLHDVRLVLSVPMDCSASGIVVDGQGRPMPKATVSLDRIDRTTVWHGGHAETGPDGRFTMERIAAGRFKARALPDGVTQWNSSMLVPEVELAPGQNLQGLRLVAGGTGSFSISGRALDHLGHPVANVKVTCQGEGETVTPALTGKDGRYQLTGLKQGEYWVNAQHKQYRTLDGQRVEPGRRDVDFLMRGARLKVQFRRHDTDAPITKYSVAIGRPGEGKKPQITASLEGIKGEFSTCVYPGKDITITTNTPGFATDSVTLDIADGAEEVVVFRLRPGGPFAGRVVDATGAPVADAKIHQGDLARHRGAGHTPLAVSGPDGTYAIDMLAPDAECLTACHDDYPAEIIDPREETDFVLHLAGRLEGCVTFDGEPFEGATVALFLDGDMSVQNTNTRTDAEGHFQFEQVRPGNYLVWVKRAREDRTRVWADVEGGKVTEVNCPFENHTASVEGDIRVAGQAAGTVSVILDIETDVGKEGWWLTLKNETHYEFTALPAGKATLTIGAPGVDNERLKHTVEFDIGNGQSIRQDKEF